MISILPLKMYFSYNQHAFIFPIIIITVNKKNTNYKETSPNAAFWAQDPACEVIIYIENLNTDHQIGGPFPSQLDF